MKNVNVKQYIEKIRKQYMPPCLRMKQNSKDRKGSIIDSET